MTTRFNFIGMVTADLTASLAFYRRLGLDVPDVPGDAPHVEVTLPGGMRLAWDNVDTVKSFAPDFQMPQGEGRIGMAFECDDAAEVDAVHAELVGAGYKSHREPWDAPWGQRYAQVQDPDGNVVDFYAALS